MFPSCRFREEYVKVSVVPCIPQNRVILRLEHKNFRAGKDFKAHPALPSVSHWGIKK